MHKRSKTRTPKEWEEVIQDWQRSGLSKRAYYKEKQMNGANFHVWIKRLRPSLVNEHFREIAKKWESIIEDWETSGLGPYNYCQVNIIKYGDFCRWRKKLRPDEESRSAKGRKMWEGRIEEWKTSGLGISAFCKQKNISAISHFYEWVQKLCPSLYIKESEKRIKKWNSIIEEWEASDLNKTTYCKEKGIAWQGFYKWDKQLNPYRKTHSEKAQARWNEVLEEWKKSGLTANAYILENELTCTFYHWKKKLHGAPTRESMHKEARERWTEIIEDWKQSGWSRYVYCIKKGIGVTNLYRWERMLNPEGAAQRLSQMKEPPTLSDFSLKDLLVPCALGSPFLNKLSFPSPKIELMLAQKHRLILEGNFDERELSSFLTPLLNR